MESEIQYDVSVIVLTYNPKYEKLLYTLKSILVQKNISFQIVVSDDGSKENYFSDIRLLFEEYHFKDYKLVDSSTNTGTCLNYKRGIEASSGLYIKAISPGDFLFDENVLSDWIAFMKNTRCQVSFGQTVYYSLENGTAVIRKEKCQPQRIELYHAENYNKKAVIMNYIFLLDPIVGSALVTKRDILLSYLNLIIGKVKYAEDTMFRIMIFDDIQILEFPRFVVYYEHGTGISTSKSKEWAKIIKTEIIETNEIIKSRLDRGSFFNIRIKILFSVKYASKQYTILKYLLFPNLIYKKIIKNKNVRYSPSKVDNNLLGEYYNAGN